MFYGIETCILLIFEGPSDSTALNCSLNARFGLEGAPFYLTVHGTGPDAAVVPLSSAIPAGTCLALHVRERELQQRACVSSGNGTALEVGTPGVDHLREKAQPLLTAEMQSAASSSNASISEALSPQEAGRGCPRPAGRRGSYEMLAGSLRETNEVVDRMQRLNTDLANERTLLAWTRTSLAAMRTAFAFLAVTGEGAMLVGLHFSRWGMATLCLLAAGMGIRRYVQVKRITFQPVTPDVRFGRISIHWFTWFLSIACAVMSACMYSRTVQKL